MVNGRLLSLKLDYNNKNPNDKNLINMRVIMSIYLILLKYLFKYINYLESKTIYIYDK